MIIHSINRRLPIVFILSFLHSGCAWVAWIGYNPRVQYTSASSAECMVLGVQNLDSLQTRTVLTAAEDVCRIMRSMAFKTEVGAKMWIARCEDENEQQDTLPGSEVLEILESAGVPRFSVHDRHPWNATGQADPHPDQPELNRIAIKPKYIRDGLNPDVEKAAPIRNTLAHEFMHIVSTRFQDEGWGETCQPDRLVSYGIGDLVERIWIAERSRN